jgi:glycosyltransferase involved in cell wall biosynthesis
MSKELTLGTGGHHETIHAGVITDPAEMAAAGIGGSVGGGGYAAGEYERILAEQFPEIATRQGLDLGINVVTIAPTPYAGFDETRLPPYPNTQRFLFDLPLGSDGKPVPYMDMVDYYLDRGNRAYLDRIEPALRQLKDGGSIRFGNYWVDMYVMQELTRRYGIDVQHWGMTHSALAGVIDMDSQEEGAKIGQRQREIELEILRDQHIVVATQADIDRAVAAYTGVRYGPREGDVFTGEQLRERFVQVPLAVNTKDYGIDTTGEKRAAARQYLTKYGIEDDDILYMMVSRLDTEKGYDLLVDAAMPYLEALRDAGVPLKEIPKFAIFGGVPTKDFNLVKAHGAVKARLEDFKLRHPDLAGHLIMEGDPEPHPVIAHAADVVLGPSRTETWHMTVKEDAMCGTPLILSDIPVHRETHPHARRIDFRSREQAFAAFEELRDPRERARLGEACYTDVTGYTTEAVADAMFHGMMTRHSALFR